jgi:hypothetical protein
VVWRFLCPITGQAPEKYYFYKKFIMQLSYWELKLVYKRRLYNRGSGIVGLHAVYACEKISESNISFREGNVASGTVLRMVFTCLASRNNR